VSKAPLTTSQLRAAWSPACAAVNGVKFTLHGGAVITVDRRIVPAVEALNAIFVRWDYRCTPPDCGAFVCRKITGGSGYSLHAYLIAIDVNWLDNPYTTGPLVTDMDPRMIAEIVALRTKSGAPVWGWGGHYRSIKDAMHFEIVCTPADLATGIANAAPTGDIDIMDADTRAYFDAKFLALYARIEKAEAELKAQAKRHNEAERKRDAAHQA